MTKIRIHKVFITAIACIYEGDDVINEKPMKQIIHYVVDEIDLNESVKKLEKEANDTLIRQTTKS